MMPLDLQGVKEFIEQEIMDDECVIYRDAGGSADDVWDPVTGEYTADEPDLIYEGKCYMSSLNQQPAEAREGGAVQQEEWYNINIPLDVDGVPTPLLMDGDAFRLTSSLRWSQVVDTNLRVEAPSIGTHKVKQKARARRLVSRRLH